MSTMPSPPWTIEDYERDAAFYQSTLPLEHYTEGTDQSSQREVTMASLSVLRGVIANFHLFSELLIQYWDKGRIRRVVPDNMVVLGELEQRRRRASYAIEIEHHVPFWTLEYVSTSSYRKDYTTNFRRYERHLKIPYYLAYRPETSDLRLYRHNGRRYALVKPSESERLAIPELQLEVGLVGEWVRYWHRGHLLELPTELTTRLNQAHDRLRQQDEQLRQTSEQLQQQSEVVQQQAQSLNALFAGLSARVEARARRAGRQDILDQLASVRETQQLFAWLDELEGT